MFALFTLFFPPIFKAEVWNDEVHRLNFPSVRDAAFFLFGLVYC